MDQGSFDRENVDDGSGDVAGRRLQRLRDELADEEIPLTFDGPTGSVLLREVIYARRPPRHEGWLPRYGCLVFDGVPDWDELSSPPILVTGDGVDDDVLRRCADGRSSFVVATDVGLVGLANFDRSVEAEVAAVRLPRTGATVVQRTSSGQVRVCTERGVVVWNGSQWLFKTLAEDYVAAVCRTAPVADRTVASGLLELAVHSLAAAGVGATLIWNLDGAAPDDSRGGLVELGRAIRGPALSVTRRAHFASLLSLHGQVDLATIVSADGSVGPLGARLHHSRDAGERIAAVGGARHTSARRFSADVPGAMAIVCSMSGRVTIFWRGAVVAEIDGQAT